MAVAMAGTSADYLVDQMAQKRVALSVSHLADPLVAKMAGMKAVPSD